MPGIHLTQDLVLAGQHQQHLRREAERERLANSIQLQRTTTSWNWRARGPALAASLSAEVLLATVLGFRLFSRS